jgi:hypothetical protein
MINKQEEDFRKFGGIRERMHQARTAYRAKDWETSIYSTLASSSSANDLAVRAQEIRNMIDSMVSSIKHKKGWHK